MPIRIERVTPGSQPLKLMVYGDPGVGKTTLASQAQDHPYMSPALLLNLEGGLLAVQARDDIDQVRIQAIADLEEVLLMLGSRAESVAHYRTVILDSASEMVSKALQEWIVRGKNRLDAKGKGDPDRSIDEAQIEDYGRSGTQMRRLFQAFRDLPHHTILTSLAKQVQPDTNNAAAKRLMQPIEVRPAMTDSVGTAAMGVVDHLWYFYERDGQRHLLTQRSGPYHAKTRGERFAPALGAVVTDPYLPELYDLLLRTEGGTPAGIVRPAKRLEALQGAEGSNATG
jgi:hypothetical protein